MADTNIFDCSLADLLCNEETTGLCFDDNDDVFDPFNDQKSHEITNGAKTETRRDSGALVYLPILSEECVSWMVESEREHLPRADYLTRLRTGDLDADLRSRALHWMFKASKHCNFGEPCLCSAASFFDRFVSVYKLCECSSKRGDKMWVIQLVAVACLLLAAKIEEVNVPSTLELQAGTAKLVFEAKAIERMEYLVLNHLHWKVKAYTPCNFIDYYLRKANGGDSPSTAAVTRSLQIILSTIQGIEFLEYMPSEIAAAVAVYVTSSGENIQATDIDKALSGFIGIENKGRAVKCLEVVKGMGSNNGTMSGYDDGDWDEGDEEEEEEEEVDANELISSIMLSLPHSPNGVLEAAACLSLTCKTDDTTVRSCPSSSSHNKRRKIGHKPN